MPGRVMTALLVFLLLGFPSPALAQTERGSIVGIARDATGGVLPGVSVTVTNTATGGQQTYVTNSEGLYEAPFLSPGTYRVSASLDGFTTSVIEAVDVNIGRRATANLTLTPAGVTAEVTVVALDPRVEAHAYHIFSMRLDAGRFGAARQQVIAALEAEGVPVTASYPHPLYRNALFDTQSHRVEGCPHAQAYCCDGIWLPHQALLAEPHWIESVARALAKVHAAAGMLARV